MREEATCWTNVWYHYEEMKYFMNMCEAMCLQSTERIPGCQINLSSLENRIVEKIYIDMYIYIHILMYLSMIEEWNRGTCIVQQTFSPSVIKISLIKRSLKCHIAHWETPHQGSAGWQVETVSEILLVTLVKLSFPFAFTRNRKDFILR